MSQTALQDYLKAIYKLQEATGTEPGPKGDPASTSALSERLEVAQGSVTGMLKKLAEKDYVSYEPYRGVKLTEKGNPTYEAVETVLKGLEIPLPRDVMFYDKYENPRRHIRTRWWEQGQLTYRDLAMVPEEAIEAIPHDPVPEDVRPGYEGDKPLFVGHYWLTGDPKPLSPHIACLDYSIAGGHTESGVPGKLVGYRWHGEEVIEPSNFCWVTD